tara:strand:+ start:524 stop:1267 length:744 start_codon:yes stop_codon:yes gene_type:complete
LNFFSLFKRNFFYKFKKKINIDLDNVNQNNLDELFRNFGSDKANYLQNEQDIGHGFTKFYTNNLNHLKKRKIKILEVGSYAGASAASFVKYFENSTVYCFDVNISKFNFQSKNIKVYGLDINNKDKLEKTLKKISLESNSNFFDIIIDDGSHYLSDILIGLKFLFKRVKQGGFYIIEDYKHPNYYEYNKNINHMLVDEVLSHIIKKKIFNSNILSEEEQVNLHNNIEKIETYRGNLKDSDICFIKKN